MSTQQIQINGNTPPTPAQPGVFSPQAVTASAGDNLTWVNNDSQDHWPAPSAANKTGWFQYQIPAGSESRGDVALSANTVTVTAATNADQAVFTTQGPAPATGVTVRLNYKAPNPAPKPPSPWLAATNGKSFVATNLGPSSCSIPLKSTTLGPLVGTITIAIPYTLNYVCALHPAETGTITVNPQQ
jgi:plastocyanin